jgi:hypothetical protein
VQEAARSRNNSIIHNTQHNILENRDPSWTDGRKQKMEQIKDEEAKEACAYKRWQIKKYYCSRSIGRRKECGSGRNNGRSVEEEGAVNRGGRSDQQKRKERSAEEEGASGRRGRSERQKRKERAAEEEGATTYWNEERASYRRWIYSITRKHRQIERSGKRMWYGTKQHQIFVFPAPQQCAFQVHIAWQ